ncbi:MAG: hypothetical protein BYD32DRAFT_85984 [Podila humilis]|nr:MAG: hypothetical protein BYD32DRAFT_85984 [Podila humilis]
MHVCGHIGIDHPLRRYANEKDEGYSNLQATFAIASAFALTFAFVDVAIVIVPLWSWSLWFLTTFFLQRYFSFFFFLPWILFPLCIAYRRCTMGIFFFLPPRLRKGAIDCDSCLQRESVRKIIQTVRCVFRHCQC